MNAGQLETEAELKRLEAELEKTYKQARDEIQKKLDDYLKKFKVQEKEWRKKFDSGEITEEIQTIVSAATYLSEDYVTEKIMTILGDGDRVSDVLDKMTEEESKRFNNGDTSTVEE